MWFRRSIKRNKEEQEPQAAKRWTDREPSIHQGVLYLYLIIGLQILFVFVIMGMIMFLGKVISTPGWVFLGLFVFLAAAIVYTYRKIKRQFRRLKEAFGKADRNYEISIMGGMLTMRIEQNPNATKLLEAPFSGTTERVIDAETKEENSPDGKPAHLF